MASHEELITELPKLDKLSNAARLKHAKKRRLKQIKKYQEWVRQQRALSATASTAGGSVMKKSRTTRIVFEDGSILNDMVSRNELTEVRLILERGVDPNISNADGLTPLHKCCIDNTVELAQILLEYGADLNARDVEGWTPLHAASATGNLHMINLLLDEGASLTAINLDDKMPIDVAADADIKYIMQQRMLEAGYTDDVLEYIRVSVPKTMLADLKDSVKTGRSLNVQDKFGGTALHVAAANGYAEVLEFLLSRDDTTLDVADMEGWTPFHAAVCWEQQDAMRRLAEKGANMDIKNLHGETAYVIADEPEIRQYILELKSQYGKSTDRDAEEEEEMPEDLGPRTRRLSVRRVKQAEKDGKMKDSIKEEAMLRRASMVKQDNDRSLLGRHDSKAMDTCLGDDNNGVQLIGMRTLSTGEDSIEVTSDLPSPVSLVSSGDDSMDPSVVTAITEVSASGTVLSDSVEEEEEGGSGAAGKAGGEEEGVGDGGRGGSGAKEEEGGEEEGVGDGGRGGSGTKEEEGEGDVKLKKRGSELAIENAQKQALDDIEEQLAPNKSSRNPRKSVLKRTQPTPVHSGPTYTCTSPVGEPYDSDGDRRQQTGQECCSVM